MGPDVLVENRPAATLSSSSTCSAIILTLRLAGRTGCQKRRQNCQTFVTSRLFKGCSWCFLILTRLNSAVFANRGGIDLATLVLIYHQLGTGPEYRVGWLACGSGYVGFYAVGAVIPRAFWRCISAWFLDRSVVGRGHGGAVLAFSCSASRYCACAGTIWRIVTLGVRRNLAFAEQHDLG